MNSFAQIQNSSVEKKLENTTNILLNLPANLDQKLAFLESSFPIKATLSRFEGILDFYKDASTKYRYYLALIVSFEQAECILKTNQFHKKKLISLLDQLFQLDSFYALIGGLPAYYQKFLELLIAKEENDTSSLTYYHPPCIDLRKEPEAYVEEGLKALPEMAEIYPIGGAGDRLGLLEPIKNTPLPAAKLVYREKTLLQGLIEDLEAREYLYFQRFGKTCITPIVLMTSHEKNNHSLIQEICEQNQWFGRGKENFLFMTQPLVPVISEEGNWVSESPFTLCTKPGGHGVLWLLAQKEGILKELAHLGRRFALIRQINNPVAGTDNTLLALAGAGVSQNKTFGFVGCQRLVKAAEGMDLLIQRKSRKETLYSLRNIEYTDFKKAGIEDLPSEENSPYSAFPANTNILFVDLQKIEAFIPKNPFPGALINLKQKVQSQYSSSLVSAGRLEATMQNIVDVLEEAHETKPESLNESFVLFNERRKTLSVTKCLYKAHSSAMGTPESCLYDQLENAYELLKHYCLFDLPKLREFESFLKEGPSFMFSYHPALGPLYKDISKKLYLGSMQKGSSLEIGIANFTASHLHLNGSLSIQASDPFGKTNNRGQRDPKEKGPRCTLNRVFIHNTPFVSSEATNFWIKPPVHEQSCSIRLHGNAEFLAKNVSFKGSFHIEVPDGFKYEAKMKNGKVIIEKVRF